MMDDELRAKLDRFSFMVEDAKRDFGRRDMCDPVVWAILRVVQAQNDFAHAIDQANTYGVNERVVEAAIKDRRNSIAALQEVLKHEPYWFLRAGRGSGAARTHAAAERLSTLSLARARH
jgi:hypothetical protein